MADTKKSLQIRVNCFIVFEFKNLVLAAIALVAGVVANAQVTTSSIAGRVVDNDGPVAGAAVIATYTPTGSNYFTVTDANGAYRIPAVRTHSL